MDTGIENGTFLQTEAPTGKKTIAELEENVDSPEQVIKEANSIQEEDQADESYISYYRKWRLIVRKNIKTAIEDFDPSKRENKLIKKEHTYKKRFSLCSTIGPFAISMVAVLLPKFPAGTRLWLFSGDFIWSGILVILTLGVVAYIVYSFFIHDIYEELLKDYRTDRIKELEKEVTVLKNKNDHLENRKNGLEKSRTIVASIENSKDNPQKTLADRIFCELGSGEYSVGVYYTDEQYYTLDIFFDSRNFKDQPYCYEQVLHKEQYKKHSNYAFYKALFEMGDAKYCFLEKEKVKDVLRGDTSNINQYACCAVVIEKKYHILLEIIAYGKTEINKEQYASTKERVRLLFSDYIGHFKKYTKGEAIKKILEKKGKKNG